MKTFNNQEINHVTFCKDFDFSSVASCLGIHKHRLFLLLPGGLRFLHRRGLFLRTRMLRELLHDGVLRNLFGLLLNRLRLLCTANLLPDRELPQLRRGVCS